MSVTLNRFFHHCVCASLLFRRLQGAAFSGGELYKQSPNDPEVAGVPDVTLAYVHKDKPSPYQVIK